MAQSTEVVVERQHGGHALSMLKMLSILIEERSEHPPSFMLPLSDSNI